MSAGKELWGAIRNALLAEPTVTAELNAIYDKVPNSPWGEKNAYMSRGPFYGTPDDADCVEGQEITIQLDIWSRKPNRWSMDDTISAVRKVLHERDLVLPTRALASLRITLWRIIDDPDPLTVHGVVQVTALIEEPEDA